jgi:hypothetical protein
VIAAIKVVALALPIHESGDCKFWEFVTLAGALPLQGSAGLNKYVPSVSLSSASSDLAVAKTRIVPQKARPRSGQPAQVEGDCILTEDYLMPVHRMPINIAILDDYQNVALKLADWSSLQSRARITVFNDHISDPGALIERLKPFEVLSVMRERTPLPRSIIEQLPNLKLIASNARRNASVDVAAAKERGIIVCATGYSSTATVELTWALIHALLRNLPAEHAFRTKRRLAIVGR